MPTDLGLELEPLPPQGFEDFDPRPRHAPPEPVRLTPGWLALAAVLLAAVGVFAAYRASAVNALRTLERDRHTADALTKERVALANRLLASVVNKPDAVVAAEGNRALMRENRRRNLELAERAGRVSTLDKGVRKARDALVGALLRDAHDLDHALAAPIPDIAPKLGGDYQRVDALLDRSLKRWGLDPAPPPPPPVYHAADEALARLQKWTDEPTDARLLVLRDTSLRLLTLDTGVETAMGRARFTSVTPAKSFVAVSSEDGVDIVDLADPADRRRIAEQGDGPALRTVRASEPDTVWLQRGLVLDSPVERVDRTGQVLESVPTRGLLVAEAGPMLLWLERPPDGSVVHLLTDRAGRLVRRYENRELLDASAGGVAWRANGAELAVTDAAGNDVVLPPARHWFLRDAGWSPDGSRLAVAWADGSLDVHDMATGTIVSSIAADGAAELTWTSDGTRLFFTAGTSYHVYRPGQTTYTPLRVRRSTGRLIAALSP